MSGKPLYSRIEKATIAFLLILSVLWGWAAFARECRHVPYIKPALWCNSFGMYPWEVPGSGWPEILGGTPKPIPFPLPDR